MADKKKMSVADILAAARKADGGAASDDVVDEPAPAADSAPAEEAAAAPSEPAQPAAKPKPAKGASGGRPSVAEMLAMARGEKGGAAKPAPAKEAPAKKPAAAAKAKPAAKKPAAAKSAPTEPRDTASILAAARKANKAGPISKAEAAAKDKANPKAKPKIAVPPMPEKPAYAKPVAPAKKAKGDVDEDRRGFLWAGFGAIGVASSLAGLAVLKFLFPNVRREPPSKFKVGFPDAYPAGQVQTKFKAQYGVWISNAQYNGQQQIYALKSVCTHLGCTPSWLDAEQKFKCPCHGSGFYKDGINFEGPAPRPLERCAVRIADDGQIEIDKSRTFQEEMGQWEDPACYIPV